ncbi:MAG: hypothetical protein KBS60_04240 [Phascolarctobacterium sp.]|nr:hypothetical protein [Candidatus Phascolarctobacterium caballi]
MTTDGIKRTYTFGGGEATGYKKSTITLSGHTGVNNASGSATINFTVSNGIVKADAGALGVAYSSNFKLTYTVSTAPSSSGGGSITISPMTQYTQKAIKPAWVSNSGTGITKTFLVRQNEE